MFDFGFIFFLISMFKLDNCKNPMIFQKSEIEIPNSEIELN